MQLVENLSDNYISSIEDLNEELYIYKEKVKEFVTRNKIATPRISHAATAINVSRRAHLQEINDFLDANELSSAEICWK